MDASLHFIALAVFVLAWWLIGAGAALAAQPGAAGQVHLPDAFTQCRRLGRGVNILGYDPIWRDRSQACLQARHMRLIKEAGFGHVRINMFPFRHMATEPDHAISETWLETLDWAVQQTLDSGLMVILDLHEFTAMGRELPGNEPRFFAAWRQLAPRYRDAPDTVLFEMLNEPHGQLTPELWNRRLLEALRVIRASNPNRTVIIGPGHWNSIRALPTLELPEDDRNIIVTVHFYDPFEFTHQGAAWAGARVRALSGIEWHGTPEEKALIGDALQSAQHWAQERRRPMYLGEFGAYDKGDMASRARWTGFVAREAERLGWAWAYWQFDSDFILYDMEHDRWVEPILRALVPPEE